MVLRARVFVLPLVIAFAWLTLAGSGLMSDGASGALGRIQSAVYANDWQAALALYNQQYRAPLGLPPAEGDGLLTLAAKHHADYIARGGAFGHTEDPNRPGFTGVAPWDRCRAVGVECDGEIVSGDGDLGRVMGGGWIDAPYHAIGLLTTASVGCGASSAATVCDLAGHYELDTSSDDAPANALGAPLRIWPTDEARDVPLRHANGESPDPLASYSGNHDDVGPPLYLYLDLPAGGDTSAGARATVTLSGSDGRSIPLIVPATAKALQAITIPSNGRWSFAFPAKALKAGTTYTISVTAPDGYNKESHFQTIALENNLNIATSADDRARVRVEVFSPAPHPRLTLDGPGGHQVIPLIRTGQVGSYQSRWLALKPGRWHPCVSSGGDSTGYQATSECVPVVVEGYAEQFLTVGVVKLHGNQASLIVKARGPLSGRKMHVSITFDYLCRVYSCFAPLPLAVRPIAFTAVLRSRGVFVARLAPHVLGVRFELVGDRFVVGATPYTGFDITRSRRIER